MSLDSTTLVQHAPFKANSALIDNGQIRTLISTSGTSISSDNIMYTSGTMTSAQLIKGAGTKTAAITAIDVTSDNINLGSGKVYKINGTQVVQAGIGTYTGFTGTATKNDTINADSITATDGNLQAISKRLLAIETDLRTHGLLL